MDRKFFTVLPKLLTALVCAVFLSALALPLSAHHGTAGYDLDKVITVKGTVSDFDWTNPHAVVRIAAKNDKGETEEWTIELGAPGSWRAAAGRKTR
jgi:hypothetical protein